MWSNVSTWSRGMVLAAFVRCSLGKIRALDRMHVSEVKVCVFFSSIWSYNISFFRSVFSFSSSVYSHSHYFLIFSSFSLSPLCFSSVHFPPSFCSPATLRSYSSILVSVFPHIRVNVCWNSRCWDVCRLVNQVPSQQCEGRVHSLVWLDTASFSKIEFILIYAKVLVLRKSLCQTRFCFSLDLVDSQWDRETQSYRVAWRPI